MTPGLLANPFAGANHSIATQGGSTFEQWFNPAAFVNPPAGTFETSPRNGYRGLGFGDVDFSVVKNTIITERAKVQFRIEMLNLFNRANLAPPTCSSL